MTQSRRIEANIGNVFRAVKENIRTDDAARQYGLKIGKNKMACCPFHNDNDPSMKIDHRFHCFGCGADGDVIDFTARLFGISSLDAAIKLADDFGVSGIKQKFPGKRSGRRILKKGPARGSPRKKKMLAERCLATQERFYRVLADYRHMLMLWKETEAPLKPGDDWNDRFCEALSELSFLEFLMDEILEGTPESKVDLMNCYRGRVKDYERRLDEYTAGETGGV